VAVIAGDRSLTYAELADRARRLANGLRTLGVARGHRVAWLGPNHPTFLESLFAVGLLGAAGSPGHAIEETVGLDDLCLLPHTSGTTGRPKGELRAWCREHLTAYQVPAFVTFVGCLPRNSVGKLIRAELHNDAALAPPPPLRNGSGR
jgi:acyl-CoA synthetase (AMP-forming)/AMP-acid ligase II